VLGGNERGAGRSSVLNTVVHGARQLDMLTVVIPHPLEWLQSDSLLRPSMRDEGIVEQPLLACQLLESVRVCHEGKGGGVCRLYVCLSVCGCNNW
jgi:hypothetical protein